MQKRVLDASRLDIDSFLFLLAAIARRAISDLAASSTAAQRAEAEDFLNRQFPTWRTLRASSKQRQKRGKVAVEKRVTSTPKTVPKARRKNAKLVWSTDLSLKGESMSTETDLDDILHDVEQTFVVAQKAVDGLTLSNGQPFFNDPAMQTQVLNNRLAPL